MTAPGGVHCRIAFAAAEYPPHAGGAARSARRLVQGLARAGCDVVVFSAVTGDRERATLPSHDEGVPIHWLPIDVAAAVRAIRAEDARRPFDLFHGFALLAACPCLHVAEQGNRPVVASIRGLDGLEFDELTRDVLRRAHWVTSVSGDSLVRASEVADLAARSSVIPNGIDTRRFPRWESTPENAHVVGTVATFREKKNIPLLVEAYARLPRQVRRHLLLVGEAYFGNALLPAGRAELEAAIDATGVRREVIITGVIEHDRVAEYHRQMRVFVLSSDHEGMPNAVLEAAASGMPIVATGVDGVKDLLTHDHDALLVPCRDAAALAGAIGRVLTDDRLARRLAAEARATAERLSPAVEVGRYLDVYRSLLAVGTER